jgi:dehydrogenase/reductase SDR family member 4
MDSNNICRRLVGKVAIVTASTAGIGLGIARRLASGKTTYQSVTENDQNTIHTLAAVIIFCSLTLFLSPPPTKTTEGASVVISSRKQQSVDQALSLLHSQGLTNVVGIPCHVGNPAHLKALISFTLSTFNTKHIDILVSNAAVNPTSGPILDTEEAAIDKLLDINIKSAILLSQFAVPHMRKKPRSGTSSIVFISSYTAFNPSPPIALYAVTKTALLGLTKALAEELGPSDRIRVNAICPGIIPTKFAASLVSSEEAVEYNESRTLLGRLGTPEDIAGACAFLVSDDAAYVTAEVLVVAGGMQSRL